MKSILLLLLFIHSILIADAYPYIKPLSVEIPQKIKIISEKLLDEDKDGVLDYKDKCPRTLKGEMVNEDGCLLVDDSDNDGVPDTKDKCQNTPKDVIVTENGCELDSDNDGIGDSRDKCEDTDEGFIVDNNGCAKTKNIAITFANKSYKIPSDAYEELDMFLDFLYDNEDVQVIIYGYSNDFDNEVDNKDLAKKRADALKKYMLDNDISITRLTAIGEQDLVENHHIKIELIQ